MYRLLQTGPLHGNRLPITHLDNYLGEFLSGMNDMVPSLLSHFCLCKNLTFLISCINLLDYSNFVPRYMNKTRKLEELIKSFRPQAVTSIIIYKPGWAFDVEYFHGSCQFLGTHETSIFRGIVWKYVVANPYIGL